MSILTAAIFHDYYVILLCAECIIWDLFHSSSVRSSVIIKMKPLRPNFLTSSFAARRERAQSQYLAHASRTIEYRRRKRRGEKKKPIDIYQPITIGTMEKRTARARPSGTTPIKADSGSRANFITMISPSPFFQSISFPVGPRIPSLRPAASPSPKPSPPRRVCAIET